MSLLFKDRHIPMIRNGEKTATRRLWDDDYTRPKEGSVRGAVTHLFTPREEIDCWIRIERVYQQDLMFMRYEDYEKEGGYTGDEFREIWEDIYGEYDPAQTVDVVEFSYVGREPPQEKQCMEADR